MTQERSLLLQAGQLKDIAKELVDTKNYADRLSRINEATLAVHLVNKALDDLRKAAPVDQIRHLNRQARASKLPRISKNKA